MSDTYQKIINFLLAGLIATIGLIWNNSQKQIEKATSQLEELMKAMNQMQITINSQNFQIEMLQERVVSIDNKLYPKYNNYDPYSSPKLERK